MRAERCYARLNFMNSKKKLVKGQAKASVLRHVSAYDEMIGGPAKVACNALEVPLLYDDPLKTTL